MMLVVMRALGGGPTIYAGRTYPFGGFSEMVETAVFHPATFIDYLRSEDRPFYVLQMLLPTACCCLRKPGFAAVTLGVFTFNVVSAFGYQHDINYHYSLVLVPVLFAGTIYGISALRREQWRSYADGARCWPSASTGRLSGASSPTATSSTNGPTIPRWRPTRPSSGRSPTTRWSPPTTGWPRTCPTGARSTCGPTRSGPPTGAGSTAKGNGFPTASEVEYIVVYRHLENPDEQQLLGRLMPRLRLIDQTDKYSLYRRTARL